MADNDIGELRQSISTDFWPHAAFFSKFEEKYFEPSHL